MAVPRAMSSAVAFPADEEGWTVLDERDTALCASLRGGPTGGIRDVRVVPMDGYSDHELLAVSYDGPTRLTAATWNTGMTGKDPASGPDMMTASVSPRLEAALGSVMDMTVPQLIAEATAENMPDAFKQRVETAGRFISGWQEDESGTRTLKNPENVRIRECDRTTRFVSQGNSIHFLLREIQRTIVASYSDDIRVVVHYVVNTMFKFGPECHWQPHHQVPVSAMTGDYVAPDDEEQAKANMYLYLFILSMAMEKEPVDFDRAVMGTLSAAAYNFIVDKLRSKVEDSTEVIAVQELTGPYSLAAVRDAFPNHNVFGAVCSKPYCALLVSTAIPAEPLQLDLDKNVANRAVAARLTTPDGVFAVLTIHGDAKGITTGVLEKFHAKCEEGGIDHVLVIGDLQVGKIRGGHAECKRIAEAALGVPVAMAESIGTRRPTPKTYFDCQFKHFPESSALRGTAEDSAEASTISDPAVASA